MPNKLERPYRAYRTDPKVLQGLVWLDHVLHLSGLDLSNFALKFLDNHSEHSGLIYKWSAGKAVPTATSVQRIDKKLPGSGAIYNLPLFRLLDPRPLSKKQVKNLLATYEIPDRDSFPWVFPNDEELREQNHFIHTMMRDDSHALFSRGDIYGYTVIVGLVREAEAKGDVSSVMTHLPYMYRAFPAVARIPWFRNHINLLRKCVDQIRYRNYVVSLTFDVNWPVINKQINAPVHETIREKCPRDPKTSRFILPEDPVVYRQPGIGTCAMEAEHLSIK